jgi:hypothetical protein
MVKRGPASRLQPIKDAIRSILLQKESAGFVELHKELSQLGREHPEQEPSSFSTLSQCLKDLTKARLVERNVDTRKYELTTLGRFYPQAERAFTSQNYARRPESLARIGMNPAVWPNIVKATAEKLKIERIVRVTRPSEVLKLAEANARQTTEALGLVLNRTILEMVRDLGELFAAIMLMHCINETSKDIVTPRETESTIRDLVQIWSRNTFSKVEQMALASLSSLNRFRAFDRAIRGGAFPEGNEKGIYGIVPPVIEERLRALGYIDRSGKVSW